MPATPEQTSSALSQKQVPDAQIEAAARVLYKELKTSCDDLTAAFADLTDKISKKSQTLAFWTPAELGESLGYMRGFASDLTSVEEEIHKIDPALAAPFTRRIDALRTVADRMESHVQDSSAEHPYNLKDDMAPLEETSFWPFELTLSEDEYAQKTLAAVKSRAAAETVAPSREAETPAAAIEPSEPSQLEPPLGSPPPASKAETPPSAPPTQQEATSVKVEVVPTVEAPVAPQAIPESKQPAPTPEQPTAQQKNGPEQTRRPRPAPPPLGLGEDGFKKLGAWEKKIEEKSKKSDSETTPVSQPNPVTEEKYGKAEKEKPDFDDVNTLETLIQRLRSTPMWETQFGKGHHLSNDEIADKIKERIGKWGEPTPENTPSLQNRARYLVSSFHNKSLRNAVQRVLIEKGYLEQEVSESQPTAKKKEEAQPSFDDVMTLDALLQRLRETPQWVTEVQEGERRNDWTNRVIAALVEKKAVSLERLKKQNSPAVAEQADSFVVSFLNQSLRNSLRRVFEQNGWLSAEPRREGKIIQEAGQMEQGVPRSVEEEKPAFGPATQAFLSAMLKRVQEAMRQKGADKEPQKFYNTLINTFTYYNSEAFKKKPIEEKRREVEEFIGTLPENGRGKVRGVIEQDRIIEGAATAERVPPTPAFSSRAAPERPPVVPQSRVERAKTQAEALGDYFKKVESGTDFLQRVVNMPDDTELRKGVRLPELEQLSGELSQKVIDFFDLIEIWEKDKKSAKEMERSKEEFISSHNIPSGCQTAFRTIALFAINRMLGPTVEALKAPRKTETAIPGAPISPTMPPAAAGGGGERPFFTRKTLEELLDRDKPTGGAGGAAEQAPFSFRRLSVDEILDDLTKGAPTAAAPAPAAEAAKSSAPPSAEKPKSRVWNYIPKDAPKAPLSAPTAPPTAETAPPAHLPNVEASPPVSGEALPAAEKPKPPRRWEYIPKTSPEAPPPTHSVPPTSPAVETPPPAPAAEKSSEAVPSGKSELGVEVPLMVTREMEEQLAKRGLKTEDIHKLKPEEAWRILNSENVKELTLEDLSKLGRSSLRELFFYADVRDKPALLTVLSAHNELRETILATRPPNRRTEIEQEIALLGSKTESEVREAEKVIVEMASELQQDGKISFPPSAEMVVASGLTPEKIQSLTWGNLFELNDDSLRVVVRASDSSSYSWGSLMRNMPESLVVRVRHCVGNQTEFVMGVSYESKDPAEVKGKYRESTVQYAKNELLRVLQHENPS